MLKIFEKKPRSLASHCDKQFSRCPNKQLKNRLEKFIWRPVESSMLNTKNFERLIQKIGLFFLYSEASTQDSEAQLLILLITRKTTSSMFMCGLGPKQSYFTQSFRQALHSDFIRRCTEH